MTFFCFACVLSCSSSSVPFIPPQKVEVQSGNVQTLFIRHHEQTRALFKRSEGAVTMQTTNGFNVTRTRMIHDVSWVDNDHEVKCESRPLIDSQGFECGDYDMNPQWCGFEESAYACCVCGGGIDIVVKKNQSIITNFSFVDIVEISLSLDEMTLYVLDAGSHTVNAIELNSGQVRILAGGKSNSTDVAYGTRAGFYRLYGMDVSQKTGFGLAQKGETLYIVDEISIRTIDLNSGLVRSVMINPVNPPSCSDARFFCSNGCISRAALHSPRDIVLSPDGFTAFVSDTSGIRALTEQSICQVAGGSKMRTQLVDSWDRSCARFSDDQGGGVELLSPTDSDSNSSTLLVADTGNNKIRAVSMTSNQGHCISTLACSVCGDGIVQIDGVHERFESCDGNEPHGSVEGCTYYCRVQPGYVCNFDIVDNVVCSQESILSIVDFRVDHIDVCRSTEGG